MLISPLRYPGGKAKLFGYFAGLIKTNNLLGCRYCEPYAGGAGLALKLLSTGLVEAIALNDIDEAIWAFWTSVLLYNKEFARLVRTATITIDEWHKQRQIWAEKNVSDPLTLGYATFFLNRTNRSGIIEGAGPVGGYSQSGIWRLDARFEPQKQASCIEALQPFRSRIELTRHDALVFIEENIAIKSNIIYLDPPYYVKGSKLYRNYYTHQDHVAVCNLLEKNLTARWIVSYDAVDAIRDIYRNFTPTQYSLSYSAGTKSMGDEIIYLSKALQYPEVIGFFRNAA